MYRPTYYIFLPMFLLNGCVGFMNFNTDFIEINTELKTRDQVLAKVGKPLRVTRDGELEEWYYLLSEPIVDDNVYPAKESFFVANFVIIPIWWTTHHDDNVRFAFQGEDVVGTFQRINKESGFMCNTISLPSPYGPAGCHSYGQ